jgi:hypothetical protein
MTSQAPSTLFDQFWQAYPKRNGKRLGKGPAHVLFGKLSNAEQALAVQAATHYAVSRQAKDGYARDPVRFLRASWWRDWLEPEHVQPAKPADPYAPRLPSKQWQARPEGEAMPADVRKALRLG